MFAASDGRLLIQSSEVLPEPFCRLIGVCAPHYILLRKPSGLEKVKFSQALFLILHRNCISLRRKTQVLWVKC